MSWIKKRLGEVLIIERGGSPRPIDKYLTTSHDGINWIKISDATASDKYIFETKEKIIKEGLHKTRMVNDGDFILSNSMSFGRPYIMKTSGCIHDGWLVLKQNGEKVFDTEFLYYLLSSPFVYKQFDYLAAGSTVRNLNIALVSSVKVPVPTISEQKNIVSKLDEVFEQISKAKANAEQNLKNAKELFESYLQGVFENGNENWEVNCLDELGTITSSKRIYKSEYVKDGVPFYRTKEIKELSNGKPITLELFISRQRYEQIKQSFGVPKIGDLLMSAVGTIGEIMVIENEDEFYFKDGNIVWFKDFEKLDTNYLKYALTAFVEKIKSLAIGAAYSALTIEKLNKYQIAFPSTIDEQQTIVRQLDALRAETQKLEAVYQKKIADLEELKKSILQKAFAGELKTEKAVAV
ncbi:MAG: restriction endonuclease subunit S [Sediminibacterium sp. Gen4]|jgi:type I restriction enzyme S subunit|uniref:restriction endonuclease subunit S n=1 Tax=unclassified Sediminibacterium TaxID=2635961 RepID=UPI0015B8DEB0|nr:MULTISPECIES: restriction endonuclease subunit S [unclassified Sediminibacterium]MBW0164998.1 restriction endonuclease subunit S [Sediminibacterium sp.]NWK64453.1 restriction endonuclease subunit S [Sediminibacterium sp. Gen4]